jgi:hypothetical protein
LTDFEELSVMKRSHIARGTEGPSLTLELPPLTISDAPPLVARALVTLKAPDHHTLVHLP